MKLNQAFVLFSCVLLNFPYSSVMGSGYAVLQQDELLTELPRQIRAYGTITDGNDNPIPAAQMTIVIPTANSFAIADYAIYDPSLANSTTDMSGRYEIPFAVPDPRLAQTGSQVQLLLIVRAEKFRTAVIVVKTPRLMIDYPLNLELEPCEPLKLIVIDSDGTAVAGASVQPARISGNRIPLRFEAERAGTTDEHGATILPGFELTNLNEVYVQSKALGNQQVPLTIRNGQATAMLNETGKVTGSFKLPVGADTSSLGGREIVVFSHSTIADYVAGPTRISWALRQLDDHGNFVADSIGMGTVGIGLLNDADFPFAMSQSNAAKEFKLEPSNLSINMETTYFPAATETITFTDESRNPLAGIRMSGVGRSTIPQTNKDGTYAHRYAEGESLCGQLFPFDPMDLYQVTNPFGVLLERMGRRDGKLVPIKLSRSRALRGRVVDEKGAVVPGATVAYSYPAERFTMQLNTLSDVAGNFEIRGLPPSIPITVRANAAALATNDKQTITVTSGSIEELVVIVSPQIVASPAGRIVDAAGNPVSKANVTVMRGEILRAEGFSAEQLNPITLIDGFSGTLTGADGKFRYPPVVDFANKLQLRVDATGYQTLVTPYLNGATRPVVEQTLNFGDVTIYKNPQTKQILIRCIDAQSGQPLPGTELALVGFDAGRRSATTDEQGQIKLEVADSPQVVAARCTDYQILFQFFDRMDGDETLNLVRKLNDVPTQPMPWFQLKRDDFLTAGKKLLDQLPVPDAKESTFYRQSLFFSAQAAMDFPAFENSLGGTDSTFENRGYFLLMNAASIQRQPAAKTAKLIQTADLSIDQKATYLALTALMQESPDLKDEMYGEAVVALNECSGTSRLIATGQIAKVMIADDQIDAARQIVSETWDVSDELKALLESQNQPTDVTPTEAKSLVGESRVFFPVLGLVDLDSAVRLIQSNAREQEKPGIIAEALALHSLAEGSDLLHVCQDYDIVFDRNGISNLLQSLDDTNAMRPQLAKWCAANVERMEDSMTKVAAAFFAARHLPPGEQRRHMFHVATESRAGCQVDYYFADPAKEALEEIAKFDSLEIGELDEFIFASLKHAPVSCRTYQLMGVLGHLARLLAFHDPELARKFLDSGLTTGAWQIGAEARSPFARNQLLNSAAWIDPTWATEITETIADKYSADDPVSKLELFSAMISELNSIAVRKAK